MGAARRLCGEREEGMGINGLLPVLKSVTQSVHVSAYAGHKVAIDAYGWLHRGAHQDPRGVAHKTDAAFAMVVGYCVGRCLELRREGVEAVMVFDGARLPMKEDEETKRRRSREENIERARQMEEQGNINAARLCWGRSLDICPLLAARLIDELRRHNLEFVVAPYEADAQMAFLARTGYVRAVITEDSDMVAYQCPRILYKVDKNNYGQEITYERLRECRELDLSEFSPQMILEMCIFAGCDYLGAVSGIGIKRAHGYMKKFRAFTKVCRYLRIDGYTVPQGYEARFQNAIWTFRHQRVFDVVSNSLGHVEPLDGVEGCLPDDINFLGPSIEPQDARAIAHGHMHPITREHFPSVAVDQDRAHARADARGARAGAGDVGGSARTVHLRANGVAGVRDGKENDSATDARKGAPPGRAPGAGRDDEGVRLKVPSNAAFQAATRGTVRQRQRREPDQGGLGRPRDKGGHGTRAANEPAKRGTIYNFFTVLPEKIPDAVTQPFKCPRMDDAEPNPATRAKSGEAVRHQLSQRKIEKATHSSFTALTDVVDYSDQARDAIEKVADATAAAKRKHGRAEHDTSARDPAEGGTDAVVAATSLDHFTYRPPSKRFSANI